MTQTTRLNTVPVPPRPHRRRVRVGFARFALISLLLAVAGAVFSVASAFALLSEGRVYEQISPEFKAGYAVQQFFPTGPTGMALDGESFAFGSIGAFSGSGADYALNQYLARRTSSGWVTQGLYPPRLEGELLAGLEEISPDLSRFEYVSNPVVTFSERMDSPVNRVWVREPDGSFVRSPVMMETAGKVPIFLRVAGASRDLSRLVIALAADNPPHHILEGDETQEGEQLFELEGSSLRLVALDNEGKQLTTNCSDELGGSHHGGSAFGAVSQPAGSEVFFTVCPEELYVRVDGRETVKIASGAAFQGASEDGSRVFFTTFQPLVNGDVDTGNDLYMARIGCAGGLEGEACGSSPREVLSLTQVSHDPRPGEAANVITGEGGAVVVSPDGQRVYFVATGVLSETPNGEGESAVGGAENLYVYDTQSETVSFVADLCSGKSLSGTVPDNYCPGTGKDFRFASTRLAQTTGDGRFLVFGSYGQLVRQGAEADTDTAKDIYRYDAVTGTLRRVSIGEAGADNNGNNSLFDASISEPHFIGSLQQQYELGTRAISEDGSTVVFVTSESLSSSATNGKQDVYVWHEGRVGLISSGAAIEPDEQPIVSLSGRDIAFMTSAGLVSTDTDGERDWYDARIGGGFPVAEAVREPCSADACQGALSTPAPLLVAGSISQSAGGNVPPPVSVKHKGKTVVKRKAKHGKRPSRGRGRKAGSGTIRRRVTVRKSNAGNVGGSGQ